MQEEYLDIVDENGNLTGEKELRSVVHAKGLWHWVAGVYFYRLNRNRIELIVNLRSKNKDHHPNEWMPRFGGHVESRSTIEETAIKEIREEIGIIINQKDLIIGIKKVHNNPNNREIGRVFYYNFNDNINKLSFDDGEVQEVKWMSEDEIIESMDNYPEIWASKKTGFINDLMDLKSKI